MVLIRTSILSMAIFLLSSCSNNEDAAVVPKDNTAKVENHSAAMPDVGKIDTIKTTAIGYGSSAAAATTDAMKNAILQVNGATIDSGSVQVKYGLDITDGKDALSLRATEFAEVVAQQSGGAITNFKIVNIDEPLLKSRPFKVTIEADIAHFTAPDTGKKIKLVVATPRFDVQNFVIGTQSISAQKIADDIRQKVAVALGNTGRFSILDREIDADIEAELDMIRYGDAPRSETGKLGQAVTADVIWTGKISALSYQRHARQLRTSDRELVSYSGGWAVTQKMVNVATRQIMASDNLQGRAPDVAASTMSQDINVSQVLQGMQTEIVNDIVASIIGHTFPITIVSKEGNSVVLSQGGQSVQVGARYAVVSLGKEIKDPQTGESLGRVESAFGEVVVDNVGPKLSYGHLVNVNGAVDDIPLGGLQLRKKVAGTKAAQANTETESVPAKKSSTNKRAASEQDEKTSVRPDEDGKW